MSMVSKLQKQSYAINGFGFEGFAAFCDYINTNSNSQRKWYQQIIHG